MAQKRLSLLKKRSTRLRLQWKPAGKEFRALLEPHIGARLAGKGNAGGRAALTPLHAQCGHEPSEQITLSAHTPRAAQWPQRVLKVSAGGRNGAAEQAYHLVACKWKLLIEWVNHLATL